MCGAPFSWPPVAVRDPGRGWGAVAKNWAKKDKG